MESRSDRLPVGSTSSTCSTSGSTSASGVPGASDSSSTMIPCVVGAEVDLVLGEDHPFGDLAAQLSPLERQPVRQRRARAARPPPSRPRRSSRRRRRSGTVGPRPPRPCRAGAGPRSGASPPRARARRGRGRGCRPPARRPRWTTSFTSPVEIESASAISSAARVDAHVLAQPADRDASELPQEAEVVLPERRGCSAMPLRSCAVRSIPIPNAKPVYSSGSQPTNS